MCLFALKPSKLFGELWTARPSPLLDTEWKLREEGNPSQKAYFSPGATCSPGFLEDFSAYVMLLASGIA